MPFFNDGRESAEIKTHFPFTSYTLAAIPNGVATLAVTTDELHSIT